MNPDYYSEYYRNEREHWWFQGREEILRSLVAGLDLPPSPRILNVGAATGRSSEWLGEFGQVTSVEYDEGCRRMTEEATGLKIQGGDICDLAFADNHFDLVCAFDVIEHVEYDRLAVSELKRVCRVGGTVFVTVPAFRFLWSEHDDVNHHFRRYRLKGLNDLFDGSGTLIQESYFNSFLFPLVAAVRCSRHVFVKRPSNQAPKSDFSKDGNNVFAPLLRRVFASERHLLRHKVRLPFGVSTLLIWRND